MSKSTERTQDLPQASPPNNQPQNKDLEELREKVTRLIQDIVWEVAEVAVNRANENGGEVDVSGTNFEVFTDQVMEALLASQEKMNHE